MDENQKEDDIASIEESKPKVNVLKEAFSWILVIVSAFLLSFFVMNYIIIKAEVPTSSMESTIMTEDRIIGSRIAYLFSKPKRGDIVIFEFPDNETENYIKRIIGLPNENVKIIDGKIYINNSDTPLVEEYLKEQVYGVGESYEFDVPDDCYLMLGDNRKDSLDARYWKNKYVSKDKIIGKAWFRYSPTLGFIK